MQNQAMARKNMLDCQLATNGITSPEVLEVFSRLPRELFLPKDWRGNAYIDEDLPLQNGCFCMEPVIHARMVQAAQPGKSHAVLNIGDTTGYASAVLSDLVSTVVALESRVGALDHARPVWDDLGCCNIAVVRGKDHEGSPDHAPYDLIFLNGAVPALPEALLSQLADKGRLVTVLKKPGSAMGSITVIEKIGEGKFSTTTLFDAATPYLPGFAPETAFIF